MSGNRIWAKAASDLEASGRKKKEEKSHKTLTNRTRVGAPLLNRPPNLLPRFVVLHDVITHAKFGFDRFTGFRATGCQSFYICIWKPYGPYNRLCTIVQDCDLSIFRFFHESTGRTAWSIFTINGSNDVLSRKEVPFGGKIDKNHMLGGSRPLKPKNFTPEIGIPMLKCDAK